MRLVIALGGNALLQRHQPLEQKLQSHNIENACTSIAKVAKKHTIILTHGNGPQIGLLALQNDAFCDVSPYSLDVLGAETEGMIGYMLMQSLSNHLPEKKLATLLTRTLVQANDTAFLKPEKFIGPVYTEEQSQKLKLEKGWCMKQDGSSYRRVVASPAPCKIIEQDIINHLLEKPDTFLICAGGGGVPVIINEHGKLKGVEAVVDKDAASMVLANAIGADGFIMLTDVMAVETNYGKPDSKKIRMTTPDQIQSESFAAGSMGPKVNAACDFARAGNGFSAIGNLSDLTDIIEERAGTHVRNDVPKMTFYE